MAWVNYPSLPDSKYFALAQKYVPKGAGAVFTFGVKPPPGTLPQAPGASGFDAARTFIESLELFSHLANVGDAKSLVIHPASTTHAQLSEAEQAAGGITPDMIRLSIGLEDIEDLLADLDQALAKSQTEAPRERLFASNGHAAAIACEIPTRR